MAKMQAQHPGMDHLDERRLALEERHFDLEAEQRRGEQTTKAAHQAAEHRQATFDRRYKLLELKEKREDRNLKRHELEVTQGRGIRFTSGQATVAAAVVALLSGVIGGVIQSATTRSVEADKNQSLIKLEQLKAEENIKLDRQKQEAAERLDRAKFETTLILKATEAPNRNDQIRNLKFFLNAGFITDRDGKIANMPEQDYPSSPASPLRPPTALAPIAELPADSRIRKIAHAVGQLLFSNKQGSSPVAVCTVSLLDKTHAVTSSYCAKPWGANAQSQWFIRFGFVAQEAVGDLYATSGPVEIDERLRFAIFNIDKAAAAKYGTLPLQIRQPEVGERLIIVQHAEGGPLQVNKGACSVKETAVANDVVAEGFSYDCSTLPGSGGAPVVAERDGALLGIHQIGIRNLEYGVAIAAITNASVVLKKPEASNP